MSSAFRVTSAQLRQKAEQLRSLNQQFKNSVNNLQSSENALNGMWEGDARKVFHNAFTQNKAQFDKFAAGIEQYAQTLLQAAQEYDRVEAQNASIATTS